MVKEETNSKITYEVGQTAQIIDLPYTLRNRPEVEQFLREHEFLLPFLVDAYPMIEKHFGPHPNVFLEVVTDPEGLDDRQLVVFIQTYLSPDQALDKLRCLDEEWFLDVVNRAQGKFCIHVEFVFAVDETGQKTAILIDLAELDELWEDIYDVLVSESRKDEPTISWEELKAELY